MKAESVSRLFTLSLLCSIPPMGVRRICSHTERHDQGLRKTLANEVESGRVARRGRLGGLRTYSDRDTAGRSALFVTRTCFKVSSQ